MGPDCHRPKDRVYLALQTPNKLHGTSFREELPSSNGTPPQSDTVTLFFFFFSTSDHFAKQPPLSTSCTQHHSLPSGPPAAPHLTLSSALQAFVFCLPHHLILHANNFLMHMYFICHENNTGFGILPTLVRAAHSYLQYLTFQSLVFGSMKWRQALLSTTPSTGPGTEHALNTSCLVPLPTGFFFFLLPWAL